MRPKDQLAIFVLQTGVAVWYRASTHVIFIVILHTKDTLRPLKRLLVPTASDLVCLAGIRSFMVPGESTALYGNP